MTVKPRLPRPVQPQHPFGTCWAFKEAANVIQGEAELRQPGASPLPTGTAPACIGRQYVRRVVDTARQQHALAPVHAVPEGHRVVRVVVDVARGAARCHRVAGWDDSLIALLPNVQGMVVLALAIPFAAFQHKLSLRTAVVFTATCTAICLGLRCVPCARSDHIYWAMASMVANGFSNAINSVRPAPASA